MLYIFIIIIAIIFGTTIYSPILAWHLFVYLFCTAVVHSILFVAALMNGVGHAGTGWDKTAEIIHKIIVVIFIVWNIWWTWFVFF